MKYKMCIDRFKIEKNLKQQHKFNAITEMHPPVMILDENNKIIENCVEVQIIGDSKIVYSPDKLLPISGFQISLYVELDQYKVIK